MKPELTKELKERFFAQYWGCISEVVKSNFYPKKAGDKIIIDGDGIDSYLKNPKLRLAVLLRPLSSITSDEASDVLNIVDRSDSYRNLDPSVDIDGSVDMEGFLEFIEVIFTEPPGYYIDAFNATVVSTLIDFLRFKGFAIPFMGHSVEELISAGWVKLTT